MTDQPAIVTQHEPASQSGKLRALEAELAEARETIAALRSGDVDAIVVQGPSGPQVFTLDTDDRPYRRLIEQIGEGALTLSAEGVVLYCNRRTADFLRLAPEEVVGRRMAGLIDAEDRDAFEAMLADGRGRHRVRLKTGSGEPLAVYLTLTELKGDGTRTLCGILTDLMELEEAQAALGQAHARLLAETAERERTEALLRQAMKMEAVGQLTGGIAHDFNNMLTLVIGGLEMVGRHVPGLAPGEAAARVGHGVSVAMRGAERAAALVHRLLAFSRRQPLEPRQVDVNQLIEGMLDLLRRSIGESVRLGAALGHDVWPVWVDPNQLENAILNAAVNARDAMPGGGPLSIATANRTLAAPELPGTTAGDYVVISAIDGGIGMDQGTLDRAFEPFFTTKAVGAGSGLGLSQIYGFARQSGGYATLKSQPGVGTTLEIWLPRMRVEQVAPEVAPAPGSLPQGKGGATVLVVEPDDHRRARAAATIRDLGHAVVDARDGTAALAMLERTPAISLLFLDGASGGEGAARQLAERAMAQHGGLRVLLTTTGHPGPADAAAGGRTGVRELPKPFTFVELAAAIRDLLEE